MRASAWPQASARCAAARMRLDCALCGVPRPCASKLLRAKCLLSVGCLRAFCSFVSDSILPCIEQRPRDRCGLHWHDVNLLLVLARFPLAHPDECSSVWCAGAKRGSHITDTVLSFSARHPHPQCVSRLCGLRRPAAGSVAISGRESCSASSFATAACASESRCCRR